MTTGANKKRSVPIPSVPISSPPSRVGRQRAHKGKVRWWIIQWRPWAARLIFGAQHLALTLSPKLSDLGIKLVVVALELSSICLSREVWMGPIVPLTEIATTCGGPLCAE